MCVKQDREDMNQAATIKTEIVGGDTAEDKPFLYLLLLPVSSLHTHKALRRNNNKTNQKIKKVKKGEQIVQIYLRTTWFSGCFRTSKGRKQAPFYNVIRWRLTGSNWHFELLDTKNNICIDWRYFIQPYSTTFKSSF